MEHQQQPLGKILILDDEAELRALVSTYLGNRGYLVRQATDDNHLYRLLERESFDLLILDVMMPWEDGLSICKRLRLDNNAIPILMLTARSETFDRILGLEMGSDDYLGKPFEPRELLARIQALLRRQRVLGAHQHSGAEAMVRFGRYRLENTSRQLFGPAGEILLNPGEFNLLQILAANLGRALTRDKLLELIHGRDADITERSVDVQILRLRRLLEDDPANPKYIVTLRGKGYMLIPGGESAQ